MENKREYVKPMVEIIEFSNEEVVMNIVASSDDNYVDSEELDV